MGDVFLMDKTQATADSNNLFMHVIFWSNEFWKIFWQHPGTKGPSKFETFFHHLCFRWLADLIFLRIGLIIQWLIYWENKQSVLHIDEPLGFINFCYLFFSVPVILPWCGNSIFWKHTVGAEAMNMTPVWLLSARRNDSDTVDESISEYESIN